MSNKCVTVLAPNGRRQNVKVTPNTTILQVLEEVCTKQGFKPEEYDITHHNKVMDATLILRYTGLPNNAQLEMANAVKVRAETKVKIGLALESGDRVMGEFEPTDSLWHVVKTLCPDEAEGDESADILPVIFYMGREESGMENLKNSTLRSLGLTKGGAILRFFKKTPEELHRQANVSAPLTRPSASTKDLSGRPTTSGIASKSNLSSTSGNSAVLSEPPQTSTKPSEIHNVNQGIVTTSPLEQCPGPSSQANIKHPVKQRQIVNVSKDVKADSESMEVEYEDSTGEASQVASEMAVSSESSKTVHNFTQEDVEPEETIIFLGERNAMIFDMATAKACKPEDVPDDFFDLTLDDAKQLLRDLKKRQAAMEEQPLVTAQYRELQKSKHVLNTLCQYKRCVVRIQFPNQLVLQGTFTPLEKVSHVMDFVRKHLQDPSIDFHIFTTPPKAILDTKQTLVEANCVPGVVVHFMSSGPCPENGSFLCEDLMQQVSSLSAAAAAARKLRGLPTSQSNAVATASKVEVASTHSVPSTSQPSSSKSSEGKKEGPSASKMPKWFKPSLK